VEGARAAQELHALAQMVNQAVGDAFSNILLVEACLIRKGWGLSDWAALYHDLPSRQLKVRVADRGVIVTADADRRAVAPPGLQEAIDEAVLGVPEGSPPLLN
jgi:phosphoacetylglucosamine mutase